MNTPILVLNWNRWDETAACLDSLREHAPDFPVWLVDNGSSVDLGEEVASRHPSARLLRWQRNHGFAGGYNRALRLAMDEGLDFAYLLNSDCRVTAGFIESVLCVARSEPSAAAVGSYLAYRESPRWLQFDGVPRDVGHRAVASGLPTQPCSRLSGAAMLVRLASMAECGLFDERLFCYWEDTEWCGRVRRAGWRLFLAAGSLVLHGDRGSDVGHDSLYYLHRNRYLVRRRPRQALRSEVRFIVGGLRFAAELRRVGRGGEAEAIVAGFWDGWRGKNGPRGPGPPAVLTLLLTRVFRPW